MTKARELSELADVLTVTGTDVDLGGTLGVTGLTSLSTLNTTGNVGIGTASPLEALHVTNATGTETIKIGGTETALGLTLGYDQSGSTTTYITANPSYTSTASKMVLRVDGDNSATTNQLVLDGSGNVGIGTASPAAGYKLDVNGGFTVGGTYDTNTATNGGGVNLGFDTTNGGKIQSLNPGVAWYPLEISGTEVKIGTYGLERLRIDALGRLIVGGTSAGANAATTIYPSGEVECNMEGTSSVYLNRNSSNGNVAHFRRQSVEVGSISVTGSATSYNENSDYRLKKDVQPMSGASERIMALKPVNFAWIIDDSRVDGFLAHEAQAVVPECATGTKDAMRDEEYEVTPATETDEAVMGTRSVPDLQGIDKSKLVPLLTAALQEALTTLGLMEARIAALEATP